MMHIPKKLYRRGAWGEGEGWYIIDNLSEQSTDEIQVYPPPEGTEYLSFFIEVVDRPAMYALDVKTKVNDEPGTGLIGKGILRMEAFKQNVLEHFVPGEPLTRVNDYTFTLSNIPIKYGSVKIFGTKDEYFVDCATGTVIFDESQAGKYLTANYVYTEFKGDWLKKECGYWHASWPWHRHYTFFKPGFYVVRFVATDYKEGDEAWITRRAQQYFDPLDYVTIERAKPPKPIDVMNPIQLINGYTRYQDTGSRGVNIGLTATIKGVQNWSHFIQGFRALHILDGDEGLYAGNFISQEIEQTKLGGDLYLVNLSLNSASEPGMGDDYYLPSTEYEGEGE